MVSSGSLSTVSGVLAPLCEYQVFSRLINRVAGRPSIHLSVSISGSASQRRSVMVSEDAALNTRRQASEV